MPKHSIWIVLAASVVLPAVATANHGQGSTKVNLLYNKLFATPVGARPADGGAGKAQPGEEWDGTAPAPDPTGLTGGGDLREFEVSPDFTTVNVTAAITWDAGLAVTYDLDLFIDRQDPLTGNWVQVGSGTDGQLAGDGEPTEVAGGANARLPTSWSSNGALLMTELAVATHGDIWVAWPDQPTRPPEPLVATPADESDAVFSPDGRWVLYESDESGTTEIYARSFPGAGGRWQLSEEGGIEPHRRQ